MSWIQDKSGEKDPAFTRTYLYASAPAALKTEVDLLKQVTRVKNQQDLGACGGFGVSSNGEATYWRTHGHARLEFSPLFSYYVTRMLQGTVEQDSGIEIRLGVKAAQQYGMVPEKLWPYDTKKFKVKPPASVFAEAAKYKLGNFYKVDNAVQREWQSALSQDCMIVFGTMLYPAFEDLNKTNFVVPLPRKGEKAMGGHCMSIYGCTVLNSKMYLRTLNQWGTSWGNGGTCLLPLAYFADKRKTGDCWVFVSFEQEAQAKAKHLKAKGVVSTSQASIPGGMTDTGVAFLLSSSGQSQGN